MQLATYDQYEKLAEIFANVEESADGHWEGDRTYRMEIRYDGRSRIYKGIVDLEDFTNDIARQSGCASVEEALALAETCSYGDENVEWICNCVLNQLERM